MAIDYSIFKFGKGKPRAIDKREKAADEEAKLAAAYKIVDQRDGLKDRVTGKRVVPSSPDPRLMRTRHHMEERSTAPWLKYEPSNIFVCSLETHQLLQSHAIEVEGTDANQRLVFRWNRNMVKPGEEPKGFRIASKRRSQNGSTARPVDRTGT